MSTEPMTLAQAIGRNARKLREEAGATLEAVAFQAGQCGLKWTSGKVGDLESGRVSPSLPTLYALGMAFAKLLERDVTLAELCELDDGNIQINDALVIPGQALSRALRGEAVIPVDDYLLEVVKRSRALGAVAKFYGGKRPKGVSMLDVYRAVAQVGQAEQRAAKDLGIVSDHLALLALARWKHTFSEERDARAGKDANAQRRGQVTREMKDELRQDISR
ncbi:MULTISPECIES: helix-turn-helix domain-containing protein [unclassified Nocardia]|uniref:helix-turn-helix domain-containing protein n=1 Tax=unclassified Nocardia TaxID=2637762 RepID=UPI001CE40F37|nr:MULTISPECIES: helix-turn-helix transcriptional regulator [unclassified Nocardia]